MKIIVYTNGMGNKWYVCETSIEIQDRGFNWELEIIIKLNADTNNKNLINVMTWLLELLNIMAPKCSKVWEKKSYHSEQ